MTLVRSSPSNDIVRIPMNMNTEWSARPARTSPGPRRPGPRPRRTGPRTRRGTRGTRPRCRPAGGTRPGRRGTPGARRRGTWAGRRRGTRAGRWCAAPCPTACGTGRCCTAGRSARRSRGPAARSAGSASSACPGTGGARPGRTGCRS